MKQILDFLKEVTANNHKAWFDAHKDDYLQANARFHELTEQLIEGLAAFDPTIKGLRAKDCTFRFYRDTRFSPNKEPYKTHFGAYICRGGRKSPFAGYYFHLEPAGNHYLGGSLLAAGIYAPQPAVLKSIREELMLNGEAFEKTVKRASSFQLEDDQALKKVPRGYPADSPYAEYLKFRNINLMKRLDDDFLLNSGVVENSVLAFSETLEFNQWLNRAVEYALD